MLASPDLRAAAGVVRFDAELPDAERNGVVLAMLGEARALASDTGFELQATGDVVLGAVTNQYVQADLARLTPIMLLLLGLARGWIFRERVSVALALAAVVLPSVWVFGAHGLDGPLLVQVGTVDASRPRWNASYLSAAWHPAASWLSVQGPLARRCRCF
jgi:predicted RND superfamily exporter protein